jgi:WD40 repeat protein
LEQSIENHADWVLGVAFSPDGKHLLSCSRDKTAKVWDLSAKESVLTFPDHQQPVFGVAVKADGKVGYSAGLDKQLRMWNATGEGKQIKALGGHSDDILKIVQHPKEPIMVTTSADKTVKIWNSETGANTKTLTGLNDHVFAAAISPDGKEVAAGSYDGEVKIWKVADGAVVKGFNASPGYVAPMAPKK